MKIDRRFTCRGRIPTRGSHLEAFVEIRIPMGPSYLNSKISTSRGMVPACRRHIGPEIFPEGRSSAADQNGQPVIDLDGKPVLGGERDARQVFERMAGCWTHWGKSYGYFKTQEDAESFHDEMCCMLAHQMAAPNSPQWFNTAFIMPMGYRDLHKGIFRPRLAKF